MREDRTLCTWLFGDKGKCVLRNFEKYFPICRYWYLLKCLKMWSGLVNITQELVWNLCSVLYCIDDEDIVDPL